jgi:SOS-response transcriptional repressor LexA
MSFYYSIIPSAVLNDKSLTATAKILYSHILSLANNKGVCDASNEYLLSITYVSEKTLKRDLRLLKDNGYIKVDYKQFKRRVIFPIWKIAPSTMKKAFKLYDKFIKDEEKNEQLQVLDDIFKRIK